MGEITFLNLQQLEFGDRKIGAGQHHVKVGKANRDQVECLVEGGQLHVGIFLNDDGCVMQAALDESSPQRIQHVINRGQMVGIGTGTEGSNLLQADQVGSRCLDLGRYAVGASRKVTGVDFLESQRDSSKY